MGILELIESSAIATFVRESPSLLGYTAVLSLHAIGLAIVVGANTVVSLRVLGVARAIPLEPMAKFFPIMYLGLTINAISGLLLLAANATGMLSNVLFYIKLVAIFLAVAAMAGLQRKGFSAAAATGGPSAETVVGRFPMDADGLAPGVRPLAWATLILWAIAIVVGRMTAYPYLIATWFG